MEIKLWPLGLGFFSLVSKKSAIYQARSRRAHKYTHPRVAFHGWCTCVTSRATIQFIRLKTIVLPRSSSMAMPCDAANECGLRCEEGVRNPIVRLIVNRAPYYALSSSVEPPLARHYP